MESAQTIHGLPLAEITPEYYQEVTSPQLPLIMLKLVIGSLSHDEVDMNVIMDACENPVTKEHIRNILSAISRESASRSEEGLVSIEIDLQENGKYRLANNYHGISITECSDNFNDLDRELITLYGCDLEQFLTNFNNDDVQRLLNEFFLLDSGNESELPLVDVSHLLEHSYLKSKLIQKNPTLGSGFFEEAMNVFIGATKQENLVDDNKIIAPHFEIVNYVIQGEDEAKEFISRNRNNSALLLVPYGITDRTFGENHMVLLAVRGAETAIIDPKFGWFLGDAVPGKCIKSLNWQGTFDTTNCGFYVYHMLTTALKASLFQQFKIENNGKSLGSNLLIFFKGIKNHDPENHIRDGMRKIYGLASDAKDHHQTI